MADSFDQALIPLSNDPELRDKYITTIGGIRIGRLLEDMDVFAVHLIHRHVQLPPVYPVGLPFSIVTALVDQIKVEQELLTAQDIKISGHVTWVGRSSAETTLNLHQRRPDGGWNRAVEAQFVMVAVDPGGKAYFNPLQIIDDEERALFDLGQHRNVSRKSKSKESLLKCPPTPEEQSLIHEFFVRTLDEKALSFQARVKPDNSVWMEDTKLKTVDLCHPEKRNRSGKIFGGYLMRKAVELGWTTAYVFAGSRPVIEYMDDILFDKPVDVGSVLYFSAQVAYTQDCYVQVRVGAMSHDPPTGALYETNVFHYTFRLPHPVPQVIPKSYHDAMLYLNARRHFLAFRKAHQYR